MVATRIISLGAAALLIASVAASPEGARLVKRQDTDDMDDQDMTSSAISSATPSATGSSATAVPTMVENCHGHGDDLYCVADGVEWEVTSDIDEANAPDSYSDCTQGEDSDDLICVDASGNQVDLQREGAVHNDDDHDHDHSHDHGSTTGSGTAQSTPSASDATASAADATASPAATGNGAAKMAAPMGLAALLAAAAL